MFRREHWHACPTSSRRMSNAAPFAAGDALEASRESISSRRGSIAAPLACDTRAVRRRLPRSPTIRQSSRGGRPGIAVDFGRRGGSGGRTRTLWPRRWWRPRTRRRPALRARAASVEIRFAIVRMTISPQRRARPKGTSPSFSRVNLSRSHEDKPTDLWLRCAHRKMRRPNSSYAAHTTSTRLPSPAAVAPVEEHKPVSRQSPAPRSIVAPRSDFRSEPSDRARIRGMRIPPLVQGLEPLPGESLAKWKARTHRPPERQDNAPVPERRSLRALSADASGPNADSVPPERACREPAVQKLADSRARATEAARRPSQNFESRTR